jgi:hypothetical protein
MDPIVMATITAAVSVLGSEYLKGFGNEAGQSTWNGIKSLLGWTSDPDPADIPDKIAAALTASPGMAERLVQLLKSNNAGTATAMVGKIEMSGGKLNVVNTIIADRVEM